MKAILLARPDTRLIPSTLPDHGEGCRYPLPHSQWAAPLAVGLTGRMTVGLAVVRPKPGEEMLRIIGKRSHAIDLTINYRI